MKAERIINPLVVVALVGLGVTSCKGRTVEINLPTPTMPTPTTIVNNYYLTQQEKAAAATPTMTATENKSNVLAVTTLPARPDAHINGIGIALNVRDTNESARPLFYSETGVAKGQNYVLDLPAGWSVITSSVTVAVHREGGEQQDFKNTPVVVIHGPFNGGVGLYEGALRAQPEEWTKANSEQVLKIQREQTRNPNLSITEFDK